MENYVTNLLKKGCTELVKILENNSTKELLAQVQSSKNPAGELTFKLDDMERLLKGPILYRWWVSKDVIQETMLGIIKNKIENYNSSEKLANKYDISEEELAAIFYDDKRKKENLGDSGKTYYALYFGRSMQGQERVNQHIKGPIKNSTLRRTICGLFVELPHDSKREQKINEILTDSFFEVLPLDDSIKGYIDCLESICITFGHYPLNIEGNHSIDKNWLAFLKSSRKTVK